MAENSKKTNEQTDNRKEKANKAKKSSLSTDYKLTILTSLVLVPVIAYLSYLVYLNNYVFSDCEDHFRLGKREDGIYQIMIDNQKFDVYCNMTAGGQTMLFRRRENSKINFQNEFRAYKIGFGDLNSDHFLGLDKIYLLTRDKTRDLIAVFNDTQYRYHNFKIHSEFYHYKFTVEYELDKFIDESSLIYLNNSFFSTHDMDFDHAANSNCSSGWKAGWWFTDCFDKSSCMTCLIMHGNQGVKKLTYAALLIK